MPTFVDEPLNHNLSVHHECKYAVKLLYLLPLYACAQSQVVTKAREVRLRRLLSTGLHIVCGCCFGARRAFTGIFTR